MVTLSVPHILEHQSKARHWTRCKESQKGQKSRWNLPLSPSPKNNLFSSSLALTIHLNFMMRERGGVLLCVVVGDKYQCAEWRRKDRKQQKGCKKKNQPFPSLTSLLPICCLNLNHKAWEGKNQKEIKRKVEGGRWTKAHKQRQPQPHSHSYNIRLILEYLSFPYSPFFLSSSSCPWTPTSKSSRTPPFLSPAWWWYTNRIKIHNYHPYFMISSLIYPVHHSI